MISRVKAYFEVEMRTTVVLAVMGLIVGYISFVSNNAAVAFLAMVVVGGMSILTMKHLLHVREEFRWWFGNGLVVYVFLWLVTWTIFYNVGLR